MVLAVFFFLIFAILGVSLWSGVIFQRCYMTDAPVDGDWIVDGENGSLCDKSINPCASNRYCGSLAVASRAGLLPDIDIYRDTDIEDLNFGISNFNNLGYAFLTIFQTITLEGWIDITNIYRSAFTPWMVIIYFILCVIVCSMFVLNLTIAVMLLKYDEFESQNESDDKDQDLREYAEGVGLPFKFIDFVLEQDNLHISQKGAKLLVSKSDNSDFWRGMLISDVRPDAEDWYYQNCFTRTFFYVVSSPLFNGFVTLIIVWNTIVLAMSKYPEWEEGTTNTLKSFNLVFNIIFTFEMVAKLIGFGVRSYAADPMNLFDAAIVIISLVEMILASLAASEGGGGPFSALRAFRLFRIFKVFRDGDLRMLLESILLTVADIKDYTILLALFIYVCALMGMSFFAANVRFDEDGNPDIENGEPPRYNFDTTPNALVLVFQIIIGENWNSAMYNHMRSAGQASSIYFIALVVGGNVIMLNLFLAILLGNFDRARAAGEKKKIFTAIERLKNDGYDLNVAIAYLFDDEEFMKYIEDKVLNETEEESQDNKKEDIKVT